ncbi:MAG: hypothetical protein ACK4F9_03920 [Brevinematia bacterium]
MFFVSLVFFVLGILFFALKKEIVYVLVVIVVFLVSIPLAFKVNLLTNESVNVVLHLDYSESSRDKIRGFEDYLISLDFDFVRRFGVPHNKQEDLTNLDPDQFHVIVSDFLFDVPKQLLDRTNILFVHLGEEIQTNHLIEKIFYTNVAQSDYLAIKTIIPSDVKIFNAETKRRIFDGNGKDLYLLSLSSLPKEIIVSSFNKEIKIILEDMKSIGLIWFEPNQDLRVLVNVLNKLGYGFYPMVNVRKDFSIKGDYKFKNLIVGCPKNVTLSEILELSEKGAKIVFISPSEEFLKGIIGFSKMNNIKISSKEFLYDRELGIFDISYTYPVTVKESLKYNFPKISGDVVILDKYGTTFYMKFLDREMLFILLKDISKVDVENLKVGIYSSFSYDVFIEVVKFLSDREREFSKEIYLQESAFSGQRKLSNSIHVNELNDYLVRKIKERNSKSVLESREINISSWWVLMILVIFLLSLRWLTR